MSQLINLIYISSSIELLTVQQLNDLLALARTANKKHNVTGMLLYKDGGFMQAIEGEEDDIEQLLLNIMKDMKHAGLIVLLREPIRERSFSTWSMGFKNLSSEKLEGFSEFLSSTAENDLLQSKAKTLLLSFKEV
jgi:hypothetical protein